jgi:ketosteroid isomerase-like protein
MDAGLEALVRQLSDKDEIRDLARHYADCVWRRDVRGAVELFAEDGVMDTGTGSPIAGRAALLAAYEGMLTGDLQPFVHNHVIELEGDRATGRCYLDLRATYDGVSMMGSGHYDDVYVRTVAGWKFLSRKLNMRFFSPLHEGWAATAPRRHEKDESNH